MRLIIGMSGASGAIYGIRLLQILRERSAVETHLIMSPAARQTITLETDWTVPDVAALADVCHPFREIAAPPSSGSFRTDGMIVCPCSIRTVSAIAVSANDNLLVRAADVTLKECRRLVIVPRETPLHLGHLRLLTQAAEIGAVICPPMPAFYTRPTSLLQVVDYTVYRLLDLYGLDLAEGDIGRWTGGRTRPADVVEEIRA